MSHDPVRPERLHVLLGIEYGFVVIGPGGHPQCVRDFVCQVFAAGQVFETLDVEPPANCIDSIGQQIVIRADLESHEGKEGLPFGHGITVQQNLLRRFEVPFLPAVDRVLFPFLETRVIIVAVVAVRHRHIGLFDPSNDLLVDLLLELFGRLENGPKVFILRLEIGNDLGVFTLLEPIVVVDPGLSELQELLPDLLRDGRLRTGPGFPTGWSGQGKKGR